MAYDTTLADRIREVLSDVTGITAKPMFGAYGFFRNGVMFAGVDRTALIVKLRDATADALLEPHTHPFDPMNSGKPMANWITVAGESLESDEKLRHWLDRALAVIPTTPPKKPKKPRKSTQKRRQP